MTSKNTFTVFDLKTGKPAKGKFILKNETETQHIQNGFKHRDDGPAVIFHSGENEGDVEWWWEGRIYFFHDWCYVSKASEELKTLLKLQYVEQINEEYY